MHAIEFNHDWSYRHLDAADEPFTPVTLPHDAMIGEQRSPLAASGLNSGWFEGRDYEYVRHYTPDAALAGRTMILEFEGVYHNAEVWINGEKVAFRPYGYTNFTVDVTGRLTVGQDNEIRVIARNADQPNSRWYSGAGIYRPVTLWTSPRDHIKLDGVTVRTLSIGSGDDGEPAKVEFTVATTAPGTISVTAVPLPPAEAGMRSVTEIGSVPATSVSSDEEAGSRRLTGGEPANGKGHARENDLAPTDNQPQSVVRTAPAGDGETTVVLDIPAPYLWSPEHPNLYTARIRYQSAADPAITDETEVTFGIRELAWGGDGLTINGERAIIQGACIHHDNGVLGACAYADAEERKLALLKANGYNAIRSAHNPCSKALLDAADRLGMLVMDEYIDHWYIHKTQHDYVDYFGQWWKQDLADMVVKDRNHPSVIMYSTGNEVGETAQKRGIKLAGEMTDLLHRLDPTRPVTCGINIFFNFLTSIGVGQYSDKKAAKEVAAAEKRRAAGQAADRHKAVGSEFFNNLAGLLGAGFMKTMATLPFCDWVTRDAFAAMDIAGYNYGIKRYAHDLQRYPDRLILGSETFCNDAYKFREFVKGNPRLIGDFVWSGMDYIGETGVGAWEYEDYASRNIEYGWLTAGSGRLDLTGKPLGEALYTRVALEAEPGPYIAVVPVNHTDDKHSPSAWKMSNAIDSWSWNGCEGRKANVEVYVRAASVALFVNGREVGRKTLVDDCVARFDCTWQPGDIEAVSYDASGREIGRCALTSASEHTELRAEVEWVGRADKHAGPRVGDASMGMTSTDTEDLLEAVRLLAGPAESVSAVDAMAASALPTAVSSSEVVIAPGRLAFVRVRYADEHGIAKPLERGVLTATVSGDGRLLGFGCAAPFNKGSFVTGETDTYYGEALAVVQASDDAAASDEITLSVSDGRHTTSLTLVIA
ncbi:glycosyl hydrolase family 2 [Bifidobacterium myosotis]|uniref:Glycosyl hydrolase family 2 n=1 Tax=Bifidobacterium myosotis TaxID=1630166 RepID=A0A261FP87_9BIFI|nr:glycoside hydrolase family 2 TIM barrel-domain containing protein [Bifidobacterium myosotis]OZG60636.1 glycosyl hydrolase family 2 [Bifidobacterium myosotis]